MRGNDCRDYDLGDMFMSALVGGVFLLLLVGIVSKVIHG